MFNLCAKNYHRVCERILYKDWEIGYSSTHTSDTTRLRYANIWLIENSAFRSSDVSILWFREFMRVIAFNRVIAIANKIYPYRVQSELKVVNTY